MYHLKTKSVSAAAAFSAVIISAIVMVPQGAYAQAAPSTAPQGGASLPESTTRPRPLSTVVAAMVRSTGATILADSSVAGAPVPLLTEASTAQNFEVQLDTLVKGLPQGATWAKVYLPATKSRLEADAVSDYVMAQAKLFGSAGAAAPAGMVEIMGQRVPADQAQGVITALNLKPVYLISNPLLKAAAQNWSKLSQDQQKQYAAQQAQQILNMDPAAQQQMFQQQMAVFGSVMQQMTPEQRQQMMQNFGNIRRPGQGGN
ncbi:MAG: hypothetical protein V4671_32635 [Armatimonadota bacterium]